MTSLPDHYWSKVKKTPGCWLWTAGKFTKGYGSFKHAGRIQYAHRLAWEDRNGPIAPGLSACHRCDTPACVNPDHLFLGTPAENVADMVAKGRSLRGSRQNKAKLSEADIPQILSLLAAGSSQSAIARRYKMHPSSINLIANNKTWRHCDPRRPA